MRTVPEWIADSDDQAIPPRVKLRVWERCGGRCALSGKKLMPGDAYDFDHIIALATGGAHKESNLQVVSREKHREKSKVDVALKAKITRTRQKHIGIKTGQGFRKHPTLKRTMDGRVVER